MNWTILGGRAQGTSHCVNDTPCEDYFCTITHNDVLLIFVADGAGSAICGGEGAQLACETALEFSRDADDFNENWARECILAIQTAIAEQAQANNNTPRDYACTFLGLIVHREQTLCLQVGDGAMVIDFGDGLTVPIAPMQGEYANMTHFVVDEDALDKLVVKSVDTIPDKFALMTDGLQRLALNLNNNTPPRPIFHPIF